MIYSTWYWRGGYLLEFHQMYITMKICKKCGVVLCEKNWCFHSYLGIKRLSGVCKHCRYHRTRCYYRYPTKEQNDLASANGYKISLKLNYLNNKERWHQRYLEEKESGVKASRVDPIKERKRCRLKGIKSRATLDDNYVKKTLLKNTTLKCSDIPQELVELKRKQLKTHRLWQSMK